MNISTDDNALDFELALSIAAQFRFDMAQAKDQVVTIKETVSHWRDVATPFVKRFDD